MVFSGSKQERPAMGDQKMQLCVPFYSKGSSTTRLPYQSHLRVASCS